MITFASESYTKHPNPFWRQERRILPAGFKPVQEFPVGTKIYRGAWVKVLAGLTCAVVKVAQVLTGGTTTKPRVVKGGYFQVGDVVMDLSNNAKTTTVKAIDTSNPDYDVLTLNAAISTLAEGHFIQEANEYGYIDAESTTEGALKIVASGATTGQVNLADVTPYLGEKTLAANDYVVLQSATPKFIPNSVLAEDEEFVKERYPALAPAYDAVLLKDILPPFPEGWLIEGGYALKTNPNIKVIEQ